MIFDKQIDRILNLILKKFKLDKILKYVEEENALKQFWSKNDKGTIKIVHILFKQFLEDNGFYN